ncbi:GNAT family N-acetyltransferase [Szabonella alba]|uniref:GNAT family N-acetyltransferase n=1 Tax=Szabonella alba TaxID=2804194 RepID=A0A8K0VAW3_9RHOB|nr:GNAT family N-acetyltransferase [Szabonella alba]MBL4916828.1 GNAT family N-acetyltransferase [Szabonella alba]
MIRQAVAGDEPAIRACAVAAFAPYIPLIGRPPAPMTEDFTARIAAGQAYVATDAAGDLTGFILFWPEGDGMLLDSVAVLPRAAGRGIGGALIRFCEDRAQKSGLCAVRLYTNAKMTGNLLLYPRLGYRQTDRRHEAGFDRVYFEKTLK